MTLSTGNYYDVIFLPKWRTQIWGKIDLYILTSLLMLLCCILDVYLSFLFVCTESLALVSDPTSRRFIHWLLLFEWEAIPKDKDLHGKRTRIWGYSNFIGHRFVERHRFEERTRIWGRTWIWVLNKLPVDNVIWGWHLEIWRNRTVYPMTAMFSQQKEEKGLVKIWTLIRFGSIWKGLALKTARIPI
jgi:hypothetical protein